MLGIIGAMQAEIDLLLEEMENVKAEESEICTIYSGVLRGASVALIKSGVGKAFAAMGAQKLILSCRPDAVLFVGIAGAIVDGLAVGDAVLMTHAVQHDIDTSAVGDPVAMVSGPDLVRFPADTHLLALLREAADAEGVRSVLSGIVTGDQFIVDERKKRELAALYDASACEMECGAAAQACYAYRVPFAAVRTISDAMGMNGKDYIVHKKTAADACARLTMRFCEAYARSESNG